MTNFLEIRNLYQHDNAQDLILFNNKDILIDGKSFFLQNWKEKGAILIKVSKKMCNEIKRQLYATDRECEICSNQILHGRSNVQKMTIKTWKNVLDQLTRNDGFNALRLNCINSSLPACAMIPNQQNFTRHDERLSETEQQ